MLFIHFFALAAALIPGACLLGVHKRRGPLGTYYFFALLAAPALCIRFLAAALSMGFGSDTACFAAWADRMSQTGPAGFYSPDVFTDYPPGYMYILWLIGAVRNLFRIEYYSIPHLILLKLPAIACDMACGLLIFRESARKYTEKQAFWLCAAYLLNPAVILNSSVWGQVDSLFTLAAAYMCLCLIRRKMYPACIAFGLGVLAKPQMLLFAPILLTGAVEDSLGGCLRQNRPDRQAVFPANAKTIVRNLLHNLLRILSVAVGILILCLPFGLGNVGSQYLDTLGSYPYAAVNACNFWGLLGLNWVRQDNLFLGVPYRIIGSAALAATVALVLYLGWKYRQSAARYPFLAALLVVSVFLFSVRMHERYLYPALALLLLSYVCRPSPVIYLCYVCFSVMHFYNTATVLFFYDPANYDRKSPVILLTSAGMLASGGLLYYAAHRLRAHDASEQSLAPLPAPSRSKGSSAPPPRSSSHRKVSSAPLPRPSSRRTRTFELPPLPSRKTAPLTKIDLCCILCITAVYSCLALYDLGDRQAPVTAFDMEKGQSVTLDFGDRTPAALAYYIAPWHQRNFTVEGRTDDSGTWEDTMQICLNSVFTWQKIDFAADFLTPDIHQLRLTLKENQASILELAFLDQEGNVILPVNAADYPTLFDEAALYPEAFSFRNSMYFDEIYHARTAYEFLHGLTSYENTHPPLGKIWIALGVAIFGMNPFGWRIAGTLFGIAMVPAAYLFARRVCGNVMLSALACVLFSFDFMHFTQTRIATIDVYVTFFVILMYFFMYRYCCLSFYDTPLRKTLLPLGACGICMALGVACKWSGVYAGCGLALIFFYLLHRRYREYLFAKKTPYGRTNGILHAHIIHTFPSCAKRTVLFCLVFFVAAPALIYLLSYLPFRGYTDKGLIGRMLDNQADMFHYHSTLNDTHAYSSLWYEWPVITRPIWYYSRIVTQTAEGGLREGISAFGNPAVWWAGIPAVFYMVYLLAKKKDRTAAFLLTGYLAQYLPWIFVTRLTFIYHYFPSVIFTVLMVVYSLAHLRKTTGKTAFAATVILYGLITVGLFALFYPVLSGQPVEAAFVAKYLRWFPKNWVLTAR